MRIEKARYTDGNFSSLQSPCQRERVGVVHRDGVAVNAPVLVFSINGGSCFYEIAANFRHAHRNPTNVFTSVLIEQYLNHVYIIV